MPPLTGTYDCRLDAKGRFMLPASLKKQLGVGLDKYFIIKRSVFQNCLEMYPADEWEKVTCKINKLNRFKKKNNDFIRRFVAGVNIVDIDNVGRLLIPKVLCAKVGLNKKIVLSSAINIIEIWDRDHYENVLDDSGLDFGSLAEEVMGNNNWDDVP